METSRPLNDPGAGTAHIGKSVIVKGELSGSEDLYLDGEVEGMIELHGHSLVIGPNGRVRARIQARDVIIHGKIDGNVQAMERVELRQSAVVVGDIVTRRIVMEEGAYFKGKIDVQKEAPKPQPAAAIAAQPAAPVLAQMSSTVAAAQVLPVGAK